MAYHDWHVGMKVVCVDPTWGTDGTHQKIHCPNLPVAGGVYTIRSVECYKTRVDGTPEVLIRLVEVINPVIGRQEAVFFASKYRRVQNRKTDISIFTAMLNSQKQGVDA